MINIPDDIQVGSSFRIYYDEDNPNNKVIHVRGLVDDQIVIRHWNYRRQCWTYEIKNHIYFEVLENYSRLTKIQQ